MNILKAIENVIGRGKVQAANTKPAELNLIESVGPELYETDLFGRRETADGTVILGDSVRVMKALLDKGYAGKFSMIYVDPPFFTKRDFDASLQTAAGAVRHAAYRDRWSRGMGEYLRELEANLLLMKTLLADDGLLFLHLDGHAVHYAKVLLDDLFGEKLFVNEIIWQYKSGGSSSRHFARKHDSILVYAKTPKYRFFPLKEKSYNRGKKPYRFKGVEEHCDEEGWYTVVNMKDVWAIDMVGRTSAERTGYATQKPEALLRRILACSTGAGDLVGDFFCGSGTLPATAAEMGRRFVAADIKPLAVETTIGRLVERKASFRVYGDRAGAPGASGQALPDVGASVVLTYRPAAEADCEILNLRLDDLRARRLSRVMDKDSAGRMEKAIRKDPAEMLDGWAVDLSFDGSVFRPDAVVSRRGGECPLEWERLVTERPKRILVKVRDRMGRTAFVRPREADREETPE